MDIADGSEGYEADVRTVLRYVMVQLRSFLRSTLLARGRGDGTEETDDDASVSSLDSRLSKSRKWLAEKVTELKKRLPPLNIPSNRVMPLEGEDVCCVTSPSTEADGQSSGGMSSSRSQTKSDR
jgi:hypothetical protein